MASSNQGKPGDGKGHAIPRGFASKDPERQRELPDDDLETIGSPMPVAERKGTGAAQTRQCQQRAPDARADRR